MKTYSLSDEVWLKVVQLVQLAMLTGIDVVDYLRQITVQESSEGSLGPSEEYEKIFNKTLDDLTERMVELQFEADAQQCLKPRIIIADPSDD